jgi:oligopeptide/dipeptide ABC transporter ATP-binding protein
MATPILKVVGLKKYFLSSGGLTGRNQQTIKAVDGVDFEIYPGETVGLVGESGCGKTTVGRTILKLYEPTEGSIVFEGQDIAHATKDQIYEIRSKMQMIFQDPYASLNPRHTVGDIIGSPLSIHTKMTKDEIKREVQSLLAKVGLNPEHLNRFPHEFSGGQRQRIGIARAIALQPKLIVADEPVSALDVSIQAQVLNLLDDLQGEFGLSYLIVAHDLSVVQHISDRVIAMYLGKVMEMAATETIFKEPHHPYTKALLSAVPIPDPTIERSRERITLVGDLPSPANPPSGCVFNTRCWKAQDICRNSLPALQTIGTSTVACHFPE